MNAREKESLLKAFGLFFAALVAVGALALYLYYHEQKRLYEDRILTQMREYSILLEGNDFDIDIVKPEGAHPFGHLIVGPDTVYALFPIPESKLDKALKVMMPRSRYDAGLTEVREKVWRIGAGLLVSAALLALLFSLYALRPLRDALALMERFVKDVIHDFNTPVTAIALNTQLLRRTCKDPAVDRIESSAKTIGSLYKNLELLVRDLPMEPETFRLDETLRSRVKTFETLYPKITWHIDADPCEIALNREAFIRIVDNLLSNAGKYNRPGGSVTVRSDCRTLTIEDTGVGIQNPHRVFERFYKEGERGMGLGLHIVKTLCDRLGIGLAVQSRPGEGTRITLTLP